MKFKAVWYLNINYMACIHVKGHEKCICLGSHVRQGWNLTNSFLSPCHFSNIVFLQEDSLVAPKKILL